LFKQILAGKYEFDRPWWDHISEDAKSFIRKLLVLEPGQRYTARQALNHAWIVSHCGPSPVLSSSPTQVQAPPVVATPPRVQVPVQAGPSPKSKRDEPNLAPGVQKNLQKVLSSKTSFRVGQKNTLHAAMQGDHKGDGQCIIS